MSNGLVLFEEDNLDKMFKATGRFAKSSLLPNTLRNKPDDIFTILVMGQELGLPPMQSLMSINVIQGKPCLSAQLMVGLVRNRIPDCDIKFSIDEENKNVVCKVKRDKKDDLWDYEATWNISKADAMGLTGKDNYKKQVINMLKWRAASEAIRAVFPDVLMGAYAVEEFQDYSGKEIVDVVNLKMSSAEIDEEFPIPENEKVAGSPEYRILKAITFKKVSFRNKQLKDLDPIILEGWYDKVDTEYATTESGGNVEKFEIYQSIGMYLTALESGEFTLEGKSI